MNSPPFPASHAVHDVQAAYVAYVPGSHSVQELSEVAPVVLLAFPATQFWQVLEEVADVEEL